MKKFRWNEWRPVTKSGKNNPTEQGIYPVMRGKGFKDTAIFYQPNAGGRRETNGTWYGIVTHWKPKPANPNKP